MAVYQITRIQHRRGTSGELPDALADGEIGMTTDTGEVFIGAADHPAVSGRKTYPYQNIKFITELDVQRGIKGDVYYHGALAGARCAANNIATSVVPLFNHGQREFATYEVSLKSNDGGVKFMGILTICVHPSDPNQSTVTITPGSVCALNWPGGSANYPVSASLNNGPFALSRYDLQGFDTGVTWLTFKNTYGIELILSISGREWTSPSV